MITPITVGGAEPRMISPTIRGGAEPRMTTIGGAGTRTFSPTIRGGTDPRMISPATRGGARTISPTIRGGAGTRTRTISPTIREGEGKSMISPMKNVLPIWVGGGVKMERSGEEIVSPALGSSLSPQKVSPAILNKLINCDVSVSVSPKEEFPPTQLPSGFKFPSNISVTRLSSNNNFSLNSRNLSMHNSISNLRKVSTPERIYKILSGDDDAQKTRSKKKVELELSDPQIEVMKELGLIK